MQADRVLAQQTLKTGIKSSGSGLVHKNIVISKQV